MSTIFAALLCQLHIGVGIILCRGPANERRRCNVTSSLIGYVCVVITHTDIRRDWIQKCSDWRSTQVRLWAAKHYNDVTMSAMAPQITSIWTVYSVVCSSAHQRKYQSSASLVFERGIHRWPVDSPHQGPVTRKCFHLMTSSWLPHTSP